MNRKKAVQQVAFIDLREQWAWRSASDTPPPEDEYIAVSEGE